MGQTGTLRDALMSTAGQLEKAPPGAVQSVFTVRTELVERVRVKATIRQFTIDVDEPPALGGTDQGPNPVELVLAALGTCEEIVYAAYAAVLGIPLDSVGVTVRGTLDPRGLFGVADVPAGFSDIRCEVELASTAPPEQIVRLAEIVEARCPVLDVLSRPVAVGTSISLNGKGLV